MARILVVEDEPDIAMLLQDDLVEEGHHVEVVGDGVAAVERGKEPVWDLIVLDVMLPRRDGFDVCRDLRRARVGTPIIILTAKTQEAEKILGLELGADDYITKPFSSRELRARIKAVLRRSEGASGEVFRLGDTEIDFGRGELRRSGKPQELTPLEFKLLATFIRHRGRALTREQLLDQVWGREIAVTDRVIDTHITNLRKKIEPDPSAPRYVVSVRGIGYRFDG